MSDIEKIITTKFILIGCINGCAHRGNDIITQEPRKNYISKTIHPTCKRNDERGIIRKNIYQRAESAKNKALEEGRTFKTAHKRWEKIADEWRNIECPFFKSFT